MKINFENFNKEGLPEETFSGWEDLTLWQKIELCFVSIAMFIFQWLILPKISPSKREINEMKYKLKYFKPTLKEGFWGKSITWEMRDTPLTDEQLENL